MDEEKKKESRSKITALLLVCLAGILSVALAACGKAGSGTEDGKGTNLTDGEPSGAYIEEEIAFPAAIQKREKGIYSILLSPDGDVVLYAGSQDEKAKQQIVRYTLQPDDTWKEEEEPWMTSIEWNERHMAGSFSYDPAGNLYITALRRVDTSPEDALPEESSSDGNGIEGINEVWESEFYRIQAGGVEAEKLELAVPEGEFITDLIVGADGRAIQKTGYSPSNDYVKDLSSGKQLCEFYRERGCPIWYGDQILTLAGGDARLLFLNGSTGETEKTVMIREEQEEGGYSTAGSSIYAEQGKGVWLAGRDGLLYLAEGGSKWEVLLEAEQSVMGMPSYDTDNLLKQGETTFYLQYINTTTYQNGLVRIRYQEGVSAEPDKVLSIYSLEECESVRQAVVEFQREHRDVRVDYRAVLSENSSATREDCIQAFHTELLAGKGADLIITDSLPVEAYIENGLLADMSGLAKELIEEDLLLENIVEAIRQDVEGGVGKGTDKLWYIPTHMKVPLWIGSKQALQSVESIEALAEASAQAEHPYLGVENYDYLLLFQMLYELYGADLMIDGEVNREALTRFYQSYMTLAEQSATEKEDRYIEQSSIGSTYGKNGELGYFSISMRLMLMEPEKIMRETGYGYVRFRESFQPMVNLAINQSSEQKELAYMFIRKMLSASIQEVDFDGLPVNPVVVEEMPEKRQENVMTGSDYYELLPDGNLEVRQIMAECPSEEELADFASGLKHLERVIQPDEQVRSLIEAELTALWRNEKSIEAASESAYQKLKNYLAE
ncbi:MAG: hypothetical protein OSJ52_07060 [Lachnospiraceae bacterium]|nr:hypothetical protein [Lachnospiraceae bacterium]